MFFVKLGNFFEKQTLPLNTRTPIGTARRTRRFDRRNFIIGTTLLELLIKLLLCRDPFFDTSAVQCFVQRVVFFNLNTQKLTVCRLSVGVKIMKFRQTESMPVFVYADILIVAQLVLGTEELPFSMPFESARETVA